MGKARLQCLHVWGCIMGRLSWGCAVCRGVGAASLRVVPMAVVSFGTYEAVRLWLMVLEEHLRQRRAPDGAPAPQPACVTSA